MVLLLDEFREHRDLSRSGAHPTGPVGKADPPRSLWQRPQPTGDEATPEGRQLAGLRSSQGRIRNPPPMGVFQRFWETPRSLPVQFSREGNLGEMQ